MSAPAPAQPPTFYRPAEVAAILRCSVWWVKNQARQRRIPYCWIGGGYRFTPEHLAEITRLSEVRPTDDQARGGRDSTTARRPVTPPSAETGPTLVARVPRRLRQAGSDTQPAA